MVDSVQRDALPRNTRLALDFLFLFLSDYLEWTVMSTGKTYKDLLYCTQTNIKFIIYSLRLIISPNC